MSWPSVVVSLLGAFAAYYALAFARNYLEARRSGFPVYACPINPISVPWLVVQGSWTLAFARRVPDGLWRAMRYVGYHSAFLDTMRPFTEPRSSRMLCTPFNTQLWICDAALGDVVLARRKDFLQSQITRSAYPLSVCLMLRMANSVCVCVCVCVPQPSSVSMAITSSRYVWVRCGSSEAER